MNGEILIIDSEVTLLDSSTQVPHHIPSPTHSMPDHFHAKPYFPPKPPLPASQPTSQEMIHTDDEVAVQYT